MKDLTRKIAMKFAETGEKFYLEAEMNKSGFGVYLGNHKLSGKFKAFYSELEERLYIMPSRNTRTGFWFERLINPKYKTL
ncbi:MAG: hypothetical protein EOM29_09965 [Bacteroidia bacterium]|nr:hypothetical protein [Bacteroidia bacterium]